MPFFQSLLKIFLDFLSSSWGAMECPSSAPGFPLFSLFVHAATARGGEEVRKRLYQLRKTALLHSTFRYHPNRDDGRRVKFFEARN